MLPSIMYTACLGNFHSVFFHFTLQAFNRPQIMQSFNIDAAILFCMFSLEIYLVIL